MDSARIGALTTESTFELATIQRLQALGYRHQHGGDIDRPLHAVVLEASLRDYLRRRYAHLPASRKVPSQRGRSDMGIR